MLHFPDQEASKTFGLVFVGWLMSRLVCPVSYVELKVH
jgi:hypothetical protein